jgi:hypothetical protein
MCADAKLSGKDVRVKEVRMVGVTKVYFGRILMAVHSNGNWYKWPNPVPIPDWRPTEMAPEDHYV